MEDKNKTEINSNKNTNNSHNNDLLLKLLSVLSLIICVLLIVLVFNVSQTNKYLKSLSLNTTNSIEYETLNDTFIETVTEENKEFEDYIPVAEQTTKNEVENSENTKKPTDTTKPVSSTIDNTSTEVNKTENDDIENKTTEASSTSVNNENSSSSKKYVLNINSKKIHNPDCSFVARTKEENKKSVTLTDDELQEYINDGYTKCKSCGGE